MSDSDVVVKIKTLGRGQNVLETSVPANISVPDLRKKLHELTDVPPAQQRLIYLGKVLKDDKQLAEYNFKPGGTIHLVASANPPPAPTESATNAASDNAPPASPGSRQTNVLMGVIPSSEAPNLDQLLTNVLNSIGINENQRNANPSASSSAPQSNQNNEPFHGLADIVQSLEHQVNAATTQTVQQSPNDSSASNSAERLGSLITRIGNSLERLQPVVNQVGAQLSRESSLSGNDRVSTQQAITRLTPALQQLCTSLAVVTSSLQSVQMGDTPGQATVSDTSNDNHRTIVGPHGNVSIHIGNSSNISNNDGTPVNVGNLMQNILGSLSQVTQQQQPASSDASEPSRSPNGSNNQPQVNFMDIINQLGARNDQQNPPSVPPSGGAPQPSPNANPFASVMQNLVGSLNGAGNAPQVNGMIDMLLQSLVSDRNQTIASFTGMEAGESSDGMQQLLFLFLSNLKMGDLMDIRQGNWQCMENLRPIITENLRESMGERSNEEYTEYLLSSASSYLNEDLLPQEIKDKRKPGSNLTNTIIGVFRERINKLLNVLFSWDSLPAGEGDYPFSQFLKTWSIDTVGVSIDRLAEQMNGGVPDAMAVVQFFISQRLYLLHSSFGPMSASLLKPIIENAYTTYQAKGGASDDMEVDYNARDLSESDIDLVIEADVARQTSQRPQPPFSDAYLQGVPAMQRQRNITPAELQDTNLLLRNHFSSALEASGVVDGNNEEYERIVEGNETLTNLYSQQIIEALRERVNNDPDFSAAQFPNTNKMLHK